MNDCIEVRTDYKTYMNMNKRADDAEARLKELKAAMINWAKYNMSSEERALFVSIVSGH